MELKYVVLALTSLCVVFIAVEEVFHFRFNTTAFLTSEEAQLVESTTGVGSVAEEYLDEATTHQVAINLAKVDTYYDDGDSIMDRSRFSKPGVYPLPSNENEEQKVDITPPGQKDRKWTNRFANVRRKVSSASKPAKVIDGFQESLKEDVKKYWEMQDNTANLTEEERLRLSPYIYNEEEELKRLTVPIVEKEMKYLTQFLPWKSSQNRYPLFRSCRYKKCSYTSKITEADLVIFAASSIRDHDIFTFQRPPGQRWLMHTIDPSIKKGYNFDGDRVKSLFNATMTYNLDADIPLLFGRLQKVVPRPSSYFGPVFERKTKMAAWFVSHCITLGKREVYVQRMQALMDVDIYGKCGNFTCGGGPQVRSQDDTVCLPMLSNDYKFYLAFENSFCMDYITEKFFKVFQDVQVIPVVRGGFDYKRYLPSGTYINADDFETPEDLAQYLSDLGNDKQRYMEILRRKDEWRLLKTQPRECLLCEYLHSNPPNKFYPNLKEKFGRGSCWFPKI